MTYDMALNVYNESLNLFPFLPNAFLNYKAVFILSSFSTWKC